MFWALFQIFLVFGLLGAAIYYLYKKTKGNQFNKVGQKGKIEVVDGVNLNYQTSTYLLNVEGQRILVVSGQGAVTTTILRDKRFEDMVRDGFEKDEKQETEELEHEQE